METRTIQDVYEAKTQGRFLTCFQQKADYTQHKEVLNGNCKILGGKIKTLLRKKLAETQTSKNTVEKLAFEELQ